MNAILVTEEGFLKPMKVSEKSREITLEGQPRLDGSVSGLMGTTSRRRFLFFAKVGGAAIFTEDRALIDPKRIYEVLHGLIEATLDSGPNHLSALGKTVPIYEFTSKEERTFLLERHAYNVFARILRNCLFEEKA